MQDTLYLIAGILAGIAAIVISVGTAVLLIFAGIAAFMRRRMEPDSWTSTIVTAIQAVIDYLALRYRLAMAKTYTTLGPWSSDEELAYELRKDGKIFGVVVLTVSTLLLIAAILAALGYLL